MFSRKGSDAGRGDAPVKVVLAESHGVVREGLRGLLQQDDGIRVVEVVGDVRDVAGSLGRWLLDVVVIGATAALMDGIAATRAIVKANPEIGVILLSSRGRGVDVQRALQAGARGYLTSESAAHDLGRAVHAAAAGKRYLSTAVADKVLALFQAGDPAQDPVGKLSATERSIVRLVADGKTSAEAGALLRLSPRTVETYRIRLMRKLDIPDLASLVKFAIRHGITELG